MWDFCAAATGRHRLLASEAPLHEMARRELHGLSRLAGRPAMTNARLLRGTPLGSGARSLNQPMFERVVGHVAVARDAHLFEHARPIGANGFSA